jgi:hypothetical protein
LAVALVLGSGAAAPVADVQTAPGPPVKIIFDTDMDTNADDAGALAMLHALADAGEVEILATVVSSHYPFSAAVVDVINTYYGRPDLPIGVPKGPGASITVAPAMRAGSRTNSRTMYVPTRRRRTRWRSTAVFW